jgi:hypothetical protein
LRPHDESGPRKAAQQQRLRGLPVVVVAHGAGFDIGNLTRERRDLIVRVVGVENQARGDDGSGEQHDQRDRDENVPSREPARQGAEHY